LPRDKHRKLVFIAGGIGITPFRSMLKYLVDTDDRRTVTLLYSERDGADLAYHDVLQDARRQLGAKIVYTLTDKATRPPKGMRSGQLTPQVIAEEVPDYAERLFYVSGSHPMVTAIKANLRSLGVEDHNIKIDFFPGYA
jgi:ferredoxin-NADP reductase